MKNSFKENKKNAFHNTKLQKGIADFSKNKNKNLFQISGRVEKDINNDYWYTHYMRLVNWDRDDVLRKMSGYKNKEVNIDVTYCWRVDCPLNLSILYAVTILKYFKQL